jgi:hypothetical protein
MALSHGVTTLDTSMTLPIAATGSILLLLRARATAALAEELQDNGIAHTNRRLCDGTNGWRGGPECSQCIVDSEAFCFHMDCSEWNPLALTKGCQPMGGFDQGRLLDRTTFLPRFSYQEGQTKDESAAFPSNNDDVNIDGGDETDSSSATAAAQFDVQIAISNSLFFLFNVARHSIL